ncbi:MAG: RND transporter [Micavibrio sp.]|nr:MAG: RND transporter [Micavibrio sp.]
MGSKIEAFALSYAGAVIRFRWAFILLTLMIAFAAGSGMPRLEFANNYRIFFSDENPDLVAFEEFQNIYTKNDNIMFVVQPKTKDLFSGDVAGAIEYITEEAWQIPFATRVDSVTNFQYSWAEGDDLTVDDLIRDGPSLSKQELAHKQQVAIVEPQLLGNMIARDVETTGINVTVQYPEKELTELPEAVAKARSIVAAAQEKYPDLHIALTGISMMNNAFMEAGMKDMQTLTPLMYLFLIIVMIFTLRSFSATIATLFVIAFSAITAMGAGGYMGIQLTPISMMAPTIVLTLAIADSVHILVSMIAGMREGQDKITALKESVRINFMAISITSLTTIIGFLTLNMLDTPPFHHLGNMTAVGIGAAWFYSLTFLPAVVSFLPIKVKPGSKKSGITKFLTAYADFVIAKQKPILIGSIAVAIVLIAMIPRIEINDQWVNYFDRSIQFRVDAEFGMDELTGVYLIEYSVESGESGGISNPAYLANLSKFTDWLRNQPEVEHVNSYTDIIKRLNKNMHGDDESWYRLPQERELAAQYLLLYEMSLPFGLDLNDRVNIDKSATRISATLGNYTTREMRDFIIRTKTWLEQNTPDAMHATATGPTAMFAYVSFRNIKGMLQGNAIAIVTIAFIIMLAMRSVGIGALSLIPNAVPILMTFGVWGLISGNIGMASATVSAVALGIVVDDSVHFLSKYLRARREKGMDKAEAVTYAFETVGLALVITTIILTFGFLVMSLSTFQINEQLGMMTAVTMVIALIMDFTLLPALLLIGHNKTKQKTQEKGAQKDDKTISQAA